MCGINGTFGFSDRIAAQQKLAAMNAAISHRGPDDEGVFIDEGIALGHRRLSIIDLSSAGHQPMSSYDGRYKIVYNGELYNFRELKFELQRVVSGSGEQAYFFRTNTDTEVVIAAYARWGPECLHRFNGMFAFAIWDEHEKELFIARDRLGIKPLYYTFTNDTLAFSSEIRALLAAGFVPRQLDESSLCDYLRYQTVHAPATIIKGVKMLMPGHYIRAAKKKVSIHSYWNIGKSISDRPEGRSYEDVCKDVNNLLTKAVERRLVADVPFGAFLSGGIDSSVIVGLMSKVSTEKVRTFSVTFDEGEFSEAKYARQIAEKFHTDHHEIRLRPEYFLEQLTGALSAMDHPSGDGINTYVVSKATKEAGITMALSGLGGDELFAGYDIFRRALELKRRRWLNAAPGVLKRTGGNILAVVRPGIASEKIAALLKQRSVNFHSFYPISRQVMMDQEIRKILKAEELSANAVDSIISSFSEKEGSLISTVSMAEISTYMQNVLLSDTDQMSMAHALEVRVPFIDYTLVEYVLGIPDKYKYPSSPKKLLVDAMGDLLPSEIVNRPKMGFTFPWKKWMKNELKAFCAERMKSLAGRSQFNAEAVNNLWNSFLADDPRVTWSRIWYLVVLEHWLTEQGVQ